MVDHHGSFYAIVVGGEPPLKAVSFAGLEGRDSGFMVVFSDAPSPEELEGMESVDEAAGVIVEPWGVADLGCLMDEFPELAAALDLAREHGEVWADGAGGWVPLPEDDES